MDFEEDFVMRVILALPPSSFELVSLRHEFLENCLIRFGPELWFGVAHRSGANCLSTISIAVNSDSFSSATHFGVIL